ncbi:hypothetical protein [Herbiconiux daphne]|uniref:Uncharacterized protein n=1 Tax=Herbiconiux daphne TaxID=2970914 RepID=A0ABT2GWP0_9MICO|nr:hypothetical protein [Herbiconiux daphne]MCS5732377.1 hypothetical protein [Herbiconiux daphne]
MTFREFYRIETTTGRTPARALAVWLGIRSLFAVELVVMAAFIGTAPEELMRQAKL